MDRFTRRLTAVNELKSRSKSIAKAVSISLINQGVSSGTNFALAIYLVRALTTADFGMYGIGFAMTLLYSGVCDALFLTQMVVHVPEKEQKHRLPYAARMLAAMVLFCALTIIFTGLILVVGAGQSTFINKYAALILSVISASVAYALKDFFIRHSYTVRREDCALWINFAVALTLIIALIMQAASVRELTYVNALWIYASSNMAGVVVGFAIVRLPISTLRMDAIVQDVRDAWIGGRWALGGVAVTWSQTQGYMYVTAAFVGPVGVGLANMAKILITPALFLLPAITQLMMPRLATLRTTNPARMMKISMLFSVWLVGFAALYSIALLAIGGSMAQILIGQDMYVELALLVAAWCLVLIFQFSRVGAVIYLQVVKEFRSITLANTVGLLMALVIAVWLMQVIGVPGAILGGAIGELTFSFLLFKVIKKRWAEQKV